VRRRIGVLSDARGLYPRLTARENVRYFGHLHGLAGRALDERIDASGRRRRSKGQRFHGVTVASLDAWESAGPPRRLPSPKGRASSPRVRR
jgi:hypothetical protein